MKQILRIFILLAVAYSASAQSFSVFDIDDSNFPIMKAKFFAFASFGESDYNQKLSARRALATKKALKKRGAAAVGIGEEILLYNNDFPESRFYCRTVNIVVKTMLE